MGLFSALALTIIPLLKRPDSPDVALSRAEALIAELDKRLTELERTVAEQRLAPEQMNAYQQQLARPPQILSQDQRRQAMLGMQQMMQQMNMQNAQNIYQGLEHWGDICNCVPSRASLLTGDGS